MWLKWYRPHGQVFQEEPQQIVELITYQEDFFKETEKVVKQALTEGLSEKDEIFVARSVSHDSVQKSF